MAPRGQAGQVAVEQAIVMPLMVFLVLGIVQLTMMQQARIMTEYAAYSAARAGVVWNGDPDQMNEAATLALVPTMGRSDDWKHYLKTAGIALALKFGTQLLGKVPQLSAFQPVKVKILNPKPAVFGTKLSRHLNGQQIDFDDIRDANGADAIHANLLSIRVRYLYRMRVPFANWFIHTLWLGSVGGTIAYWKSIDFVNNTNPMASPKMAELAAAAKDHGADMLICIAARQAHVYLFPMTATYTMRMQSNLYKGNVVKGSK